MTPDELRALSNVTVASPCPVKWASMQGDDRQRFCAQCQLNVYNLSALRSAEATALVCRAASERICAQFFLRLDGTVMTRDCPTAWEVGLRVARTKAASDWAFITLFLTLVLAVPCVAVTLFGDNLRWLFGARAGGLVGTTVVTKRTHRSPSVATVPPSGPAEFADSTRVRHLAFVAPRFLANTNRYVEAFGALEGLRLSVISADPEASIPPALRARITGGHYQVREGLDGEALTTAARALSKAFGPVDRLTGALEQLQLPMAMARDALGIPGMGLEHATRFRDKDEMKKVLRAAGVPTAASLLATSLRDISQAAKRFGFPLIVKPPAGLGSRSTHRVENDEDIAALARIGFVPTTESPAQVEQFVRGREHTCETVSVLGRSVWRSGTRYFPTPLEVLETPWIQYCVLLPREQDESPWRDFHPVNEAALNALYAGCSPEAASCLTHMEWFLREDGTMVVGEVGARPPGVQIMPMLGLAHETNFIADWCELIAFDRFTPKPRQWATGAAFLRGQGVGGQIVEVRGIDEAVKAAGETLVEMKTPKVGMPRAAGYEGEGFAIVKAKTTDEVKAALLQLIQTIQVRYG